MFGHFLELVGLKSAPEKEKGVALEAKIAEPDVDADDVDHTVDDTPITAALVVVDEVAREKETQLVSVNKLIQTEKDKKTVLIDTPATIQKTLAKEAELKKQKSSAHRRAKKSKQKEIQVIDKAESEEKVPVPADSGITQTDKGSWGVIIDTAESLSSRLQQEEVYKALRAKDFNKTRKTKQKQSIKYGNVFVNKSDFDGTDKDDQASAIVNTKTTLTMSKG